MDLWQKIWLMGWLVIWSFEDIRCMAIYRWQGTLVMLVGLLWQCWERRLLTGDIAGGMMLGICFGLFSWVTGDCFGKGDALVILCMGLYCGFANTLSFVMIGLFLASVWAIILLVGKKRSAKEAIPLIPFLTAGYVCVLLGKGI